MKRWAVISLIGATFILVLVVVAALEWGPDNLKFVVGKPLPPRKIAPQLIIDSTEHVVLLAPDGTLWFWGGNPSRPMGMSFATGPGAGNNAQKAIAVPQKISDDANWQQVALASASLVALKSDGSLWSWNAINGRLAASNSVAGKPIPPQRMGTDFDWVQISGRVSHFMALKVDGSLWGWGQNETGQIGTGISDNYSRVSEPVMVGSDHDWKAIAAGAFNSYALKRDGTLWGWGFDINSGQSNRVNIYSPERIDHGTNWTAISVGDYHLLALKSDGTIWLRGQNAHITASSVYASTPPGSFKDKSTLVQVGRDNDWERICSGDNCFFARKRDGSWWACGSDSGGQLGLGSPINTIAIAAGHRGGGMPGDVASPQRLPFDFEPWAFGSGGTSTLLLTRDGNLWSWGTRLGVNKPKSAKEWYNDGVAWVQKTFHLKSQTPAQSRMMMRGGGSFGSGGFGSGGIGSSMVSRPVTTGRTGFGNSPPTCARCWK